MRMFPKYLLAGVAALFSSTGILWAQTDFSLLGYSDLEAYLGSGNVPDGSSVTLSIVEAQVNTNVYKIDVSDSELVGKTIDFSPLLDPLTATSWHATRVASYATGSTWSMTPGISTIYQMGITGATSTGYFGTDFLRTSVNNQAPLVETHDIQNHSWVADMGADNTRIIRRHDFSVARDNFVSIAGVNNASSVEAGSPTADPNRNVNLLTSAYHVISAGRANGSHAWGDTLLPVAGRQRPHLVVDADLTSWSTAIATSSAALLMDSASSLFVGDQATIDAARDFRMVKSLMMAGAVKDGLGPIGDHVWARESSSAPLDEVYGAGRLNVFNSYKILEAGPQTASTSSDADSTGWSLGSVSSSLDDYFYFDLAGIDPSYELSVSLNWAVDLTPGAGNNYNNITAVLANLTLSVYAAENYSVIGAPISVSNSTIENLQYAWVTGLSAGRYAIRVQSGSSSYTDYGLAWQALAIPEPGAISLVVVGLSFVFLTRRRWI